MDVEKIIGKEEVFAELDELMNAHRDALQTAKDTLDDRRQFEQFLLENPEMLGTRETEEYHFNMDKSSAFVKKAEGILEGIQDIIKEIKDQLQVASDGLWVNNDQFENLKKQNGRFMKALDNAAKYWDAAEENYTAVFQMIINSKKAEMEDLQRQIKQLKGLM